MKVDVSEIKTFKACKRQWQLTSRNKFHLRPMITPPAFAFGTIFHEALAQLYLDVPLQGMGCVRLVISVSISACPGNLITALP